MSLPTIKPAPTLSGPRVYSTDLHPINFRSGPLTADISRILLRKIKAKLLTRGVVTINGAHLVQPEIYQFLRQNDALLSDKLLLPAMREDRHSFAEYSMDHMVEYVARGWTDAQIRSAAAFVDEHVQEVLPWRVEQAADIFRANLLGGLSDSTSAICRRLQDNAGASVEDIGALRRSVEAVDSSEERAVAAAIDRTPEPWHADLKLFTHACYHLVGTKVVNCETGLDQTSMSEIRMTQFFERDGVLSDDEVCVRLLLEAAIEAISSTALPEHLIDNIPINDLSRIRDALRDAGFQAKYDQLLEEFFSAMRRTPSDGLDSLDVSHVMSLAEGLTMYFRSYLQTELPGYRTRFELERQDAFLRTTFSTVKSVLGAVPVIGTVVGIADAVGSGAVWAKDAIDLATAFGYRSVAASDARASRERQLEHLLNRIGSPKKTVILAAVRELHNLAALNMQAP